MKLKKLTLLKDKMSSQDNALKMASLVIIRRCVLH